MWKLIAWKIYYLHEIFKQRINIKSLNDPFCFLRLSNFQSKFKEKPSGFWKILRCLLWQVLTWYACINEDSSHCSGRHVDVYDLSFLYFQRNGFQHFTNVDNLGTGTQFCLKLFALSHNSSSMEPNQLRS